ncbi:MAG: hypothetical protein J1E04_04020 [Alistipes sp.]|nr:hypothetical protein [Alistipes sp.]
MNNSALVEALREAASRKGYTLRCADADRLTPASSRFPAALLAPPVVHSARGRRHGRIEYDVTLRLSDLGADLPPEERYRLRQQIENDALEIFTSLSRHQRIIAVENLNITQLPFSASLHGEAAVTAKARVLTFF